jgi:hypothetical protein
LIGALLLGERIGVQGMVAIACVVVAAIGITVMDGREKKQQGKLAANLGDRISNSVFVLTIR